MRAIPESGVAVADVRVRDISVCDRPKVRVRLNDGTALCILLFCHFTLFRPASKNSSEGLVLFIVNVTRWTIYVTCTYFSDAVSISKFGWVDVPRFRPLKGCRAQ